MASKHDFHKVVIGRSDLLAFVDFSLSNIPAKTDTGAYRSAVHAENIVLDPHSGTLSFDLLAGHPLADCATPTVTTSEFQRVVVENSFGQAEERFQVKLKVKLGPKVFVSNFTLANRSRKLFPILLGRKLINHRFLVDPSHTGLDRAALRKRYGIEFPDDDAGGPQVPESQLIDQVVGSGNSHS